ncbi:hypothetical protein, partial [Candidatus Hodarchaeum mangrovi]
MNQKHSHDPIELRKELLQLLDISSHRIDYLTTAATPLASVATSASILTFLSLQLFLNGINTLTQFLAGINILFLLLMVFISLMTQVMIYRAKLRLSRVNHDLNISKILDQASISLDDQKRLRNLSHLARKSISTIDRIQWMYTHGL